MDELNLQSASALGRSAHRIGVVERRNTVAKKQNDSKTGRTVSAQPRLHQRAREIQSYGTVKHALPLDLEEPVRVQSICLHTLWMALATLPKLMLQIRVEMFAARRSTQQVIPSPTYSLSVNLSSSPTPTRAKRNKCHYQHN